MTDGRKQVSWKVVAAPLVVGGMALGAVWLTVWGSAPPGKPVYTREGYGGIRPPAPAGGGLAAAGKEAAKPAVTDPVAPALEAYNRGDYAAAEAAARTLLQETGPDTEKAGTPSHPSGPATSMDQNGSVTHHASRNTKSVPNTQYAIRNTQNGPTRARARWVLAFSAARKKDLAEAQEQFAALKKEAAGQLWALDSDPARDAGTPNPNPNLHPNPIEDRPVSPTGELLPTLEEEAAYQHAVLTAARGKQEAAEAEFVEFMRKYPESPLVHAAVRRIGRFHGGDIPKAAEAVWKQAMATAEKRRHARDRARSLCAPAVLAEILRRTGRSGQSAAGSEQSAVQQLSLEMKTDHRGTALSALTQAAEKRGFKVSAYRLTWRALLQKIPLARSPQPKEARAQGAGEPARTTQPSITQYAIRNTPARAPQPGEAQGAPSASRRYRFVIAFLDPGHVVIVEQAAAGVVRVWDPDGAGPQQPAPRSYTQSEWLDRWKGVTLILEDGR